MSSSAKFYNYINKKTNFSDFSLNNSICWCAVELVVIIIDVVIVIRGGEKYSEKTLLRVRERRLPEDEKREKERKKSKLDWKTNEFLLLFFHSKKTITTFSWCWIMLPPSTIFNVVCVCVCVDTWAAAAVDCIMCATRRETVTNLWVEVSWERSECWWTVRPKWPLGRFYIRILHITAQQDDVNGFELLWNYSEAIYTITVLGRTRRNKWDCEWKGWLKSPVV